MNSKFRDKNLVFYRNGHEDSQHFLTELRKNDSLKSQFILINQDDPRLIIPQKIREIGESLIVIAQGLNEPVKGRQALHWLVNNAFAKRGNGLEFCNIGGRDNFGAALNENEEMGGGGNFSFLDGQTTEIKTFEDSGRGAKTSDFDKQLSRLKTERNDLMASQRARGGTLGGT